MLCAGEGRTARSWPLRVRLTDGLRQPRLVEQPAHALGRERRGCHGASAAGRDVRRRLVRQAAVGADLQDVVVRGRAELVHEERWVRCQRPAERVSEGRKQRRAQGTRPLRLPP